MAYGYPTEDKYTAELTKRQQPRADFNAFEHTVTVLDSSRSLAARVQSLCARLMGPVPEYGETEQECVGPGLFQQLSRASDETARALRLANEALDRLEKELA